MWQTSKFFKQEFICIGEWTFLSARKFPHVKYISADTETKLYYDNKQIKDDEVYRLYKENGQSWIKDNIEVRAYAFTISDGKSFALFQNIEDFITCVSMMNVRNIFWYNAKFDFALFDYYFLTHNWLQSDTRIEENGKYRKLQTDTYQSLDGDFGQRYQMTFWKEYLNRNSQKKVHKVKMLDLCNIYGGGLAKNLIDWDIEDENGNKIRKLEMDYDNADIIADLQYMINDTKGLHLLVEKVDKTLFEITGLSFLKGEFITAGGLAKTVLLREMFGGDKKWENVKLFKKYFPITTEQDMFCREHSLYQGGKCLVNPSKIGVVQRNVYKYDVNSMYPKQMRDMAYPIGKPQMFTDVKDVPQGFLQVYYIKNFTGVLKPNMIPIWQDVYTGDYNACFTEIEPRLIWLDELKELENWYYLNYEIINIIAYKPAYPKGAKRYIDKFYDIKCNSKGSVKQGAKLLLNSAYGKLAQRIERILCRYELDEKGYVHLVRYGVEIDDKSMLSVVVGSRITALARVSLMSYIRQICGKDVAKNFIYCDTDSVHSLLPFDDCDDKELGKMKCEGVYKYGLYLAPKSYLMYDGEHYEVHCKGVNTKAVEKELVDITSFNKACDIFAPNRLFKCLAGLNVKGGKALIYVDKMILNDENMEIVKVLDNYDLEDIDEEEIE